MNAKLLIDAIMQQATVLIVVWKAVLDAGAIDRGGLAAHLELSLEQVLVSDECVRGRVQQMAAVDLVFA